MAKEWAKAFYHSQAWQACRASFIAGRIAIDGVIVYPDDYDFVTEYASRIADCKIIVPRKIAKTYAYLSRIIREDAVWHYNVVRACAGVIQSVQIEPYLSYVHQAAYGIGEIYGNGKIAEERRETLINAIKFNLINRREYSYDILYRHFDLAVSLSTFKREKYRYCYNLAVLCGYIKTEPLDKSACGTIKL